MPQTFPSDWRDMECHLVAVPAPLSPYVVGLLKLLEARGFWESDDDYLNAYTAVYELERCFMSLCLSTLVEGQDRLYRMLDLALFGKEYTVVTEDPLVVTPGIPAVHESIYQTGFGLMHQVDDLKQLIDNTINGTATDDYSYTPNVKELLQGIIDALAAEDTDIGSLLTELEVIAGLLA